MILFLNVQKLKAALVFAAVKDVRTYLNGVNINLAKNRVEATNGHALIVIDNILWEENEIDEIPNTNFIINRNDLNVVFKTLDKNVNVVQFIINADDEQTAKTVQLGNLICYPLDGHFPNVEKLLNAEFSATPPVGVYPAFQTCYLEKVGKAMKIMKTKAPPHWRPNLFGKDEFSSCMQVIDDMKIVLIPLR